MISLFAIIVVINLFFVLKDDIESKFEALRGLWRCFRNYRGPTFRIPKRIYQDVLPIKNLPK